MTMFEPSELHEIVRRARAEARVALNRRVKDQLFTLARAAEQLNSLLAEDNAEGPYASGAEPDVFFLLQTNE